MTVDATALDSSGRPVPNLTAADFFLTIDGQPRPVISAEYVPVSGTGSGATVGERYATNEGTDAGRLILVAVDQRNIRRLEGIRALKAASRFIESLNPADRIAVTSLSRLQPLEFRRDRASARRRVEQLVGEADPVFIQYNLGLAEALQAGDGNRTVLRDLVQRECGRFDRARPVVDPARVSSSDAPRDACPEEIEQEARAIAQQARTTTALSMGALARLIDSLRDLDEPKTVVLLSEGLVAEPQLVDFNSLAAAAQAARVTIHVLQIDTPLADASESRPSPTQVGDRQLRADGLARLAGAARGELFTLVGADPAPFQRISLELSGYYLLAFEPRDSDRDQRVHRLHVAARRSGITIRARPTFRLDASPSRPIEEQLVRVLRTAVVATELPVRLATYVLREPNGRLVHAVMTAEAAPARGARGVDIAFVLRDRDNRVVASGLQHSDADDCSFSALVAPGEYQLKIAAIDRLGRRGSVDRRLAVHLPDSVAAVSDLVLARDTGSDAALQPIVDRAPADRLLAYVELYSQRSDRRRERVQIEVARDPGGLALLSVAATLEVREGVSIARAVVRVNDLAPGSYYVRAIVVGREAAGKWFTVAPADQPPETR